MLTYGFRFYIFGTILHLHQRMSSRAIKQEMLDTILPEVYVTTAAGSRRRAVKRERKPKLEDFVKLESGVDLKKLDVKSLTKKVKRKKRSYGDLDGVEIVGSTAPRRPYQWKGRKVKRVLRPGTVVSFTPGQRSGLATKRDYDEVMADDSILEDMRLNEGEFRYGKRARYEPLDTSNPTPSLKPVSAQHPIVMPGQATLLPTVQVMAPRKRKYKDDPDAAFDIKRRVKAEDTKPLVNVEDIKIRATKRVAPNIDVHTVDISVPTDVELKPPRPIAVPRKRKFTSTSSVMSTPEPMIVEVPKTTTVAPYGPTNKIMPKYWNHPSQLIVPPVSALPKVPRKRRHRRQSVGSNIIPDVIYHPSIKQTYKKRAKVIRV